MGWTASKDVKGFSSLGDGPYGDRQELYFA